MLRRRKIAIILLIIGTFILIAIITGELIERRDVIEENRVDEASGENREKGEK